MYPKYVRGINKKKIQYEQGKRKTAGTVKVFSSLKNAASYQHYILKQQIR